MKAGLLSIIGLSALAAAQPRADHQRFHKKHLQQRENKVEYQTDYVTAYAPAVTVYVDSNGKPCDSNGNPIGAAPAPAAQTPAPAPPAPAYNPTPQPAAPAPQPAAPAPQPAAPAPQPAAPAPQPAAPAPKAPSYTPPKPAAPASAPEPAAPAPKPSAPAPKPAPSYPSPALSGGSSGLGVTYSVYMPNGAPCKTSDQVDEDIAKIFQNGDYAFLRTYGADCQQSSKVANAIKKAGKSAKLFVTLLQISNIEAECQQLVADMNGDWSAIDTIAVGNELVNSGQASPAQIKAAIDTAKGCLTGYNGKIVTVDTFVAIIAHPELCDVGDYVAANCHPFFDGGVEAPNAGQFVLEQAQRVSQACGGKKVVITETGWPNQGSPNKAAVPSMENQQAAIQSIKSKFTDNLFFFSAFNELWKEDNAGTFGCEKYWGIIH